jgi:hypothetical protein
MLMLQGWFIICFLIMVIVDQFMQYIIFYSWAFRFVSIIDQAPTYFLYILGLSSIMILLLVNL